MERKHPQQEPIRTVTELTREVKGLMEGHFPRLWVEGEIFSLRKPTSGHLYFTLKDPQAQLAAVMFRTSAAALRIPLRDGMRVQCYGRLTVYEPQGRYQLVVEAARPAGDGALLAALEALKRKLHQEGLFRPEAKKPLPRLPRTIGLVTSQTGAAVQDMIRSIHDRYPASLLLYPCRVQGVSAAQEIAAGIAALDALPDVDVIVIGRGGGSLEDLWAFNEEEVARAIYAAKTPVVSAVGHEIDVLISDFVADMRAPTPTGVAPLVVPLERELRDGLSQARRRLVDGEKRILSECRNSLNLLKSRLPTPRHTLETRRAQLDDVALRVGHAMEGRIIRRRRHLEQLQARLRNLHPIERIRNAEWRIKDAEHRLAQAWKHQQERRNLALDRLRSQLRSLGPHQVLNRGYAIVQREDTRKLIRSQHAAPEGTTLRIRVQDGELRAIAGKPIESQEDSEKARIP